MLRIVPKLALLTVLLHVACAGGGDGEIGDDDQEIKKTKTVATGGACDPRRDRCSDDDFCSATCVDEDCLEQAGVCRKRKLVKAGELCSSTDSKCPEGLVCKDSCKQGAHCFKSVFKCR